MQAITLGFKDIEEYIYTIVSSLNGGYGVTMKEIESVISKQLEPEELAKLDLENLIRNEIVKGLHDGVYLTSLKSKQ